MKKNNSFKKTFYLGVIIILFIISISTLFVINIYKSLSHNFKKDKIETYIEDVKSEKEIVHDTVYLDKPIVKVNDTPKNVTVVTPNSIDPEKTDVTITSDTTK
jgi:hypothetical protein